MHGSVPHLHRGPHRARTITKRKVFRKGQARHTLRDDGFKNLHRCLFRRSADVARAEIMIVSENAADLSVLFDASRPVSLMPCLRPILIDPRKRLLFVSQADGFLNVVWIGRMPAALLLVEPRTHCLHLTLYLLECRIGR